MNLYGVFFGTSFGLTRNKRTALKSAREHSGYVLVLRHADSYGSSSWDAPTFRVTADPLPGGDFRTPISGQLAAAQRLAKHATNAATWRGHTLSSWLWAHSEDRTRGLATCQRCGFGAMVDSRPEPNGIDIGGTAVALTCGDSTND